MPSADVPDRGEDRTTLAGGASPPPDADELVERLVEDMACRWGRGERPLTEDYLARHPALLGRPAAVMELIYEEVCLRQEHGEEADPAHFLGRFPQWGEQLRVVLDCHHLLAEPEAYRPPAVGETLGEFRLLAELGRGARGRVFLATQLSLAGRPVVLKVTRFGGAEHLSLARLQHTHIVPLYSVQEDAGRQLRALCMPYFGGATLDRLLAALRSTPPGRRTGRHLVEALRAAQAAVPGSLPVAGPACDFLAGSSYVRAVCWVGACLAEALAYAHERGLVHLDLKPSNVLLAADGQPMLLDFHLAREPLRPADPAPDGLGGTPGYMAPEHQAALAAAGERRPLPAGVDGRADGYALGVLLYEALAGQPPPADRPARGLRRLNPQVTRGLADLLGRCLQADPARRYPGAAALAADLRRHLADLPLQGVPNRSLAERWAKWRRRRPYAPALAVPVLAALAVGALGWAHVSRQAEQARAALREGRDYVRQHQDGAAVASLRRGLGLAEESGLHGDLARELREELRLAERAQAAGELHLIVERIRALSGSDPLPPAQARAAEEHCRAFWERRDLIAQQLGPQARDDMLDLALLWTELRVRLASPGEAAAAHRDALRVLDEAEALYGASRTLCRERQDHAAALGLSDLAAEAARRGAALAPRTAWEHYALGRALLRADDPAAAAPWLERAVELQPQGLWPNFYRGKCAYRLGKHADAVSAFTACVALAPDSSWCYYNRGLAYAGLGRPDDALRDYDRALRLDPSLAAAALNRGMLHYHAGRHPEALADLRSALNAGAPPAVVCYDLALVHAARGDRPAALACLQRALADDPDHRDARALQDSLRRQR
jgi:serine/threonine protein kinase/Tfp pilus assembly protein PilF